MPRAKTPPGGRHKPPGIREIAKSLGISIGTVDRALHNRPGINEQTRRRILQRAKTLGYRPNLAARFLVSQKQLRIGVNLPHEIASFFDLVREGIQEAVHSVGSSHVKVVPRAYARMGDGEEGVLAEAVEDDLDGLIMVPAQPVALAPLMKKAAERGLPVVCVNTDAPEVEHLVTVCVDSLTTGALVGELMGRFLAGKGTVMVVTGHLGTIDHAQKVAGFRRALSEMWPGLAIAAVVEAHDHETEAYEKTRQVLTSTPGIGGVYVGTVNSIPVLKAIEDVGLAGRATVITSDLFPALAPFIGSGRVAATMYQRPSMQGQLAFQALYRFLVDGIRPRPVIRMAPHIVMKGNLKLFMDRLPRPTAKGRSGRGDSEDGEPAIPGNPLTA
ncbi:MAG TPA: substrate-binding domain-containing protein [Vicinamibacteria bacterium]|nr:substrate-binding domain-containing protein [Vicinamibacteria bacterium]